MRALVIVTLTTIGACAPRGAAIVGTYVAIRSNGSDTLWVLRSGRYVQRATLGGKTGLATGEWTLHGSDLFLQDPLVVEEFANRKLLSTMHGAWVLDAGLWWLTHSLDTGEDAPSYKRIRATAPPPLPPTP